MKSKNVIDRRKFLKMMAAGTCGAACHHILTPAAGLTAYAAQPTGPIKNYVELFFYGGCCSYGLFPKHNIGAQAKMGSLYRTPAQATPLIGSPNMSMHAAFAPLVTHINATGQNLAVIVGAGPMAADGNFTRSHEDGQNANQRTDLDYRSATGIGVGAAISEAIAHPFGLVSFDGASTFTVGGSYPARSIGSLENGGKLNFWQDDWFKLADARAQAVAAPAQSAEQQYLRNAIGSMNSSFETLESLATIQPPLPFPNTDIGTQFKDITRIIMSGLGARVFAIGIGGFDTHENQAQQQQQLFTQINDALLAFVRNLQAIPGQAAANAWLETAVVKRSDFEGRTFANGSSPAGTDHGFVGEQFILGGRIRGGIYGDVPDQAKFQNENGSYPGTNWMQFSSMQATKEIVLNGMGLNVPFPNYVGNIYTPLGIVL